MITQRRMGRVGRLVEVLMSKEGLKVTVIYTIHFLLMSFALTNTTITGITLKSRLQKGYFEK